MHSFTVDGHTLRYQDIGQGEVIVFGHSYLWDSQMWQTQVEVLSQHYRCIVPDFWGHGESDVHPASMNNLNEYAQHMLALLDSLSIDTFSLAGLSLGGMWAVELVILAPQRVKKMALLNTFVGLEPEVNCIKYNAMFADIMQNKAVTPELAEQIAALFFSQAALVRSPDFIAQFGQHLLSASAQQLSEWVAIGKMLFSRVDRFEELEKLAVPVSIIAGAQDRSCTPLESYLMNDSISGSQLHVLPECGHISTLESPELVTQLLVDFFA